MRALLPNSIYKTGLDNFGVGGGMEIQSTGKWEDGLWISNIKREVPTSIKDFSISYAP